jgi:hypothetical protein
MSDLNELHRAATYDLGPNQLQWLRLHIPQFKNAEAAVRAVREMVEANRRETETAT